MENLEQTLLKLNFKPESTGKYILELDLSPQEVYTFLCRTELENFWIFSNNEIFKKKYIPDLEIIKISENKCQVVVDYSI